MPRFPTLLALCALIAFQPNARAADAARDLTLEDGDPGLLLEDAVMERENNCGVIATVGFTTASCSSSCTTPLATGSKLAREAPSGVSPE